jgi:hypothetical protein
MKCKKFIPHIAIAAGVVASLLWGFPAAAHQNNETLLNNNQKISLIGSTVPPNGDVNPYGVVRVTKTVGNLTSGHILVSNFNDSQNLQGTGTTIMDIAPDGSLSVFAQVDPATLPGPCPGGVGLTTALAFLRTGWVIVGSLPTTNGMSATAQAGCLIVLDSTGTPVETFYGSLINGPWDMASFDDGNEASLFITNVLNGTLAANGKPVNTATVVRLDLSTSQKQMPAIESMTVVGSEFFARTDPAALVIGPTGLGLSPVCEDGQTSNCTAAADAWLYVADTLRNRIASIPNALTRTTSATTGTTVSTGGSLNAPLGLTVGSNGDALVVNGGNGYITEVTPTGAQVAKRLLDNSGTPPGAGALFGLVTDPTLGIVFVDDATNTLNKLQ